MGGEMGGAIAAIGILLLIGFAIEAAYRANQRHARVRARMFAPYSHVRTIEREDR
jgi:hypothetical protein